MRAGVVDVPRGTYAVMAIVFLPIER